MIVPISEYIHYYITQRLKIHDVKTVLDMGGTGKMKNRGFKVVSANKRYGTDCTDLLFEDNKFDATISIATLEHVGDINNQIKFMEEARRVCKKISIHWLPIHEDVEIFLKSMGHNHKCVIPNHTVILESLNSRYLIQDKFTTIKQHLLLLATINPKLNKPELYEYILNHGEEAYGVIVEILK